MSKTKTPIKSTADQELHEAPSTPGWQILLQAAHNVSTRNTFDYDLTVLLLANVSIRKNEHIPKNHMMEVALAVAAAACKISDGLWLDEFVEFFHSQLGKKGLKKLLEDFEYKISDCDCDYKLGYHVTSKNVNELEKNMVKVYQSVITGAAFSVKFDD